MPTFRPQKDLVKTWKNIYVVTEFQGSMCLPGNVIIHEAQAPSSWGMIITKIGQISCKQKALSSPWNKNDITIN